MNIPFSNVSNIINDLVREIKYDRIGGMSRYLIVEFDIGDGYADEAVLFDCERNYVKVYAIGNYMEGYFRGNGEFSVTKIADHDSCWSEWTGEFLEGKEGTRVRYRQFRRDGIENLARFLRENMKEFHKKTFFKKDEVMNFQ